MASSAKLSNEELSKPESNMDEDDELNKLLDSALQDFKKPAEKSSSSDIGNLNNDPQNKTSSASGATSSSYEMHSGDHASQETSFKNFGSALNDFMQNEPQMMKEFDKIMHNAATCDDTQESQDEFVKQMDQLAQTFNAMSGEAKFDTLNTNPNTFPTPPHNIGADLETDASFFPMMQEMMKSLMSKEILYPAIKEMSAKYPAWLAEHKETLVSSQINNYSRQLELMNRICEEFEQESAADSDIIKQRRFDSIFNLMQEMQDLGQPPSEIVGEMAPGLSFDQNGLPCMEGSQNSCCIM